MHYSIAQCHGMLDDWEKCRSHYQSFIDTPIEISNKNFRPWAGNPRDSDLADPD